MCTTPGDGLRSSLTDCYVSPAAHSTGSCRHVVHDLCHAWTCCSAEPRSWLAAQAHQVLCSLGQTAATTIAYVFRMSGLRDMLTKYGLGQGDKLVFRCGNYKAKGLRDPPKVLPHVHVMLACLPACLLACLQIVVGHGI